ncbi:D-tyrosyl-tRNA(Tyr) deacylase [Coemansia sp. RSA 1290]|nr:D-tyrosyl-tRNA(Tyr) deacylase [Coemansia sp. RSA 1086]KAJ1752211.1 D-tyrosyl-tRNA(Tyr) deacylase [Coemansia sp. RSA 1821]KAJ1873800.1 D-tyrosyl-tRNA(Tyr) deacylase [Coemansia sp. RSA 990]KAJ2629474.1 D-tyrosyl-tRNA(Tyr) deacylase [Coemansia sp. RSA 1290]KAJ2649299.1 D-tyrosyl-tRNA(Tyr) deacylase [Coemansia sp. RSA 1250]KAJ2672007.1 D-tyrosyl-tRNA(Tyr) deacylase [Coemansia sp. RSA 1085]
MRAVLQKVSQASVTVGDRVVGSIGAGICVLVGIGVDDTQEDLDYIARKVLGMRVFSDSNAFWKRSVQDEQLEVLCVSQFTLYGKTTKGSKPDFHQAMKSHESREFFDRFVARLRELYRADKVQTGEFGAMMQVALVNDGPVTLQLDSRKFTYSQSENRNSGKNERRLKYEKK